MMKKFLLPSLALLGMLMGSCIGDEPLNAECDIEEVSLTMADAESVFYHEYDTLQVVSSAVDVGEFDFIFPRFISFNIDLFIPLPQDNASVELSLMRYANRTVSHGGPDWMRIDYQLKLTIYAQFFYACRSKA